MTFEKMELEVRVAMMRVEQARKEMATRSDNGMADHLLERAANGLRVVMEALKTHV